MTFARRALIHSGGGPPIAPPPDPITVSSVWAGNVSTSGAQVKARSTDATEAALRYSTDPGLAGYLTEAGSEGGDDVWAFDLTGLSAGTLYYYGFAGSDVTGRFHTSPSGATSFGIAAASCGGHSGGEYVTDDVSNAPTYDRIADRLISGDCLGFIHMGDRHYRDIITDNDALFQDAYHDVMEASKQLAMHKAGWIDYMWDDHDFGDNDSYSGTPSKPAAQTVYRQHVPWELPEADSTQHTYVIGRVRFINLDVRSYRTIISAPDNSSKTMLGATQKAWLLDLVDTSTEALIVIHCGSPWHGTQSWTWASYTTEQDELIAEFTTMGKLDRLLMLFGDSHFLAADDGSNTPGGIPCVQFGPLDAGFTVDDGTWSEGIHKNEQQQYGTLHVDDDGVDLTLTARGWSVASSGTETERFELVLAY